MDAIRSTRLRGFTEVVFADDFNCWRKFERGIPNESILSACHDCQSNLHEWGRANSVTFDPGKESFHVLHRVRGQGEEFALLELIFDVALRMYSCLSILSREAG